LIADRLLRSSDGRAFADDRVVISRVEKSTQISECGVAAAMIPFVEYEALQWPHFMVVVPGDKSSSEPQSEQKHNEPTTFMTSGLWQGRVGPMIANFFSFFRGLMRHRISLPTNCLAERSARISLFATHIRPKNFLLVF
jgi:hypothetical protein